MNEETWITDIGKCLIILDEIPCSLMETVRDLLEAFPTGRNGTKIIITGSNEEYDIFKNDMRCYFHQIKGKNQRGTGVGFVMPLNFRETKYNDSRDVSKENVANMRRAANNF